MALTAAELAGDQERSLMLILFIPSNLLNQGFSADPGGAKATRHGRPPVFQRMDTFAGGLG
jgi:hypothetical protein